MRNSLKQNAGLQHMPFFLLPEKVSGLGNEKCNGASSNKAALKELLRSALSWLLWSSLPSPHQSYTNKAKRRIPPTLLQSEEYKGILNPVSGS